MNVLRNVCLIVLCMSTSAVHASSIDWSTVTLAGTFPTFTFTDPQLGLVTLNYSTDSEQFGLNPTTFPEATLMLGNTSGEQLVMSWANPVQSLDLRIWDIDSADPSSNELVMFTSSAASIAPSVLHATDIWTAATKTLSSDGSTTSNSTAGNFSIITLQDPATFSSVTFDWTVTGGSFTGILGIGRVGQLGTAPEPSTFALATLGLLSLGFTRRRRR